MTDYINIAINIKNKINDYSIDNLIHIYSKPILITVLIGLILIFLTVILIPDNSDIVINIAVLLFIIYVFLFAYKPKQISQFDLNTYSSKNLQKYGISETIDINNAISANDIIYDIKHNNTSSGNKSKQFTITALLEYGNINSLNTFYSNIIYLDAYYKNNYTEKSEYEWINEILNEFYKPNNANQATTNIAILKGLKN